MACQRAEGAQDAFEFSVRHRHARGGAAAVLRVQEDGIAFDEGGRHHARWQFEDIEQLTLSPATLRILTYEDRRWPLGHDREFIFDNVPRDFAAQLYPLFRRRLDQRFVAALADPPLQPLWEIPVKLLRAGGAQGRILAGADRIVFETASPEQSRTWRIPDIDVVSSSGPFDLTITTFERAGASYAGRRDFHFELKRPLAGTEYDGLWRKVNQAKGLEILNSSTQGEKQP